MGARGAAILVERLGLRARHDLVTPLRRGREHAVVGQEMRTRPLDERGEVLDGHERVQDRETGVRTAKASYRWFSDLARSGEPNQAPA